MGKGRSRVRVGVGVEVGIGVVIAVGVAVMVVLAGVVGVACNAVRQATGNAGRWDGVKQTFPADGGSASVHE